MIKEIEVVLTPEQVSDETALKLQAARVLKKNSAEITAVQVIRRSIDARPKDPVYRIQARVFLNEQPKAAETKIVYHHTEKSKAVHIIGFGPGGMFAALRLLELGYKPVVYERGRNVRERRRDLRAIQIDHIVNPDSNYCFGEGGAGTYSDGKLYTRSTKRGDVGKILRALNHHGAVADILVDAHPHIGSNKLPKVVQAIRETILEYGGEIHFNSRVTDIIVRNDRVAGLIVNDSTEVAAEAVILATGHSARDIYTLFDKKKIFIEAKPFALGVRIEHPQPLINRMLYHNSKYIPVLPPAAYNAACQHNQSGVFSFCMCPGGIIVPSATSPGELVLNGMSVSRRDSPFANSGFVVTVGEDDFKPYASHGSLRGMMYQTEIERAAFIAGGSSQKAPAQRAVDFVQGKISSTLPESSYKPGLVSAQLSEVLPGKIIAALRYALTDFDKKMRGYFSNEAVLAAPESRTSSPVRIPRDKDSFMHLQIKGLFPCGEGAGYAGGIISAAMDGEQCAEKAVKILSGL